MHRVYRPHSILRPRVLLLPRLTQLSLHRLPVHRLCRQLSSLRIASLLVCAELGGYAGSHAAFPVGQPTSRASHSVWAADCPRCPLGHARGPFHSVR